MDIPSIRYANDPTVRSSAPLKRTLIERLGMYQATRDSLGGGSIEKSDPGEIFPIETKP